VRRTNTNSIIISVPFCWPLVVRAQKRQTIRLLFIPDYARGEQINLIARDSSVKPRHDISCFTGAVTEVFPIQLKDITPEIAKMDGFTCVGECQNKLAELNGVKIGRIDLRWGFVIRWEPVTMPAQEVIDAVDRMYHEAMTRAIIPKARSLKKQPLVSLEKFVQKSKSTG
jgi:hypothetical protein